MFLSNCLNGVVVDLVVLFSVSTLIHSYGCDAAGKSRAYYMDRKVEK